MRTNLGTYVHIPSNAFCGERKNVGTKKCLWSHFHDIYTQAYAHTIYTWTVVQ